MKKEIHILSAILLTLILLIVYMLLKKESGYALFVESVPTGAEISIIEPKMAYKSRMKVKPGRYLLKAQLAGYNTVDRWVEIADKDVEEKIVLPEGPYTEPRTGMDFVWVPGGCYQMGCGSWATFFCDSDEEPAHEVCVDGLWVGKFEVTQGQWKKIMGSNPSFFKEGDNYPIETVYREDMHKFIEKLNRQNSGTKFRLPTEAEWEYSARSGGKNEIYSGGQTSNEVAWCFYNSDQSTHPVGKKSSNGLGIYDMSGNVSEGVADTYDANAYSKHSKNNPVITDSHSPIIRGGSWGYVRNNLRTTYRSSSQTDKNSNTGFRLVMTRNLE